ncbi:TMA16-like protein [Mya arenaria]|uniref:TMA16-like protein n=1 Tax=Mya arenaria TaxID=6604 RepID=A0ABY7DGT9_MYAAR|nr:TMA16-like protein [Mya arenaria]
MPKAPKSQVSKAVHPHSRRATVLRKKLNREQRVMKSKVETTLKQDQLQQKLVWFQENLDAQKATYTKHELAELTRNDTLTRLKKGGLVYRVMSNIPIFVRDDLAQLMERGTTPPEAIQRAGQGGASLRVQTPSTPLCDEGLSDLLMPGPEDIADSLLCGLDQTPRQGKKRRALPTKDAPEPKKLADASPLDNRRGHAGLHIKDHCSYGPKYKEHETDLEDMRKPKKNVWLEITQKMKKSGYSFSQNKCKDQPGFVSRQLQFQRMKSFGQLTLLSWAPTADQINSIKPDQAIGYLSG